MTTKRLEGRPVKLIPNTTMRKPRTADMTNVPLKKQPIDSGVMTILPYPEKPRNTFNAVDPHSKQPSY